MTSENTEIDYVEAMKRENARLEGVAASRGDDVRRLYELCDGTSGSARISTNLLRIVHQKRGSLDLLELRYLDVHNKAAALRLIELCGSPGLLPDTGLGDVLTSAEIKALFANHCD